jgi:hypothetical protein
MKTMAVHSSERMLTCDARPNVPRPYRHLTVFGYGALMSAQPAESSVPARKYPAKNLDAIVLTLDNPDVEEGIRTQFQAAFAKAWVAARDGLTIQPLLDLVESWFPAAVLWSDPAGARAYNAKIDDYVRNGVPPENRVSTESVLQVLEAKHGKGAMGPIWDRLAGRA